MDLSKIQEMNEQFSKARNWNLFPASQVFGDIILSTNGYAIFVNKGITWASSSLNTKEGILKIFPRCVKVTSEPKRIFGRKDLIIFEIPLNFLK